MLDGRRPLLDAAYRASRRRPIPGQSKFVVTGSTSSRLAGRAGPRHRVRAVNDAIRRLRDRLRGAGDERYASRSAVARGTGVGRGSSSRVGRRLEDSGLERGDDRFRGRTLSFTRSSSPRRLPVNRPRARLREERLLFPCAAVGAVQPRRVPRRRQASTKTSSRLSRTWISDGG